MWMSSGTNTVARPAWTWRKYSSKVQLAATERSAVCQVCMWAFMSPGSTKWPAQSIVSASAWSVGAMAAMRPFSTSTSPVGSTPSLASCVTTMPDFRRSLVIGSHVVLSASEGLP